ncbi:MAG: dihydroorotate dehydrogenase electron transfer subunit [Myxococcota bacterium]
MIRAIGRVLRSTPRELTVEVPRWPGHRPGQFVMLAFDPEGPRADPLLPRPMAIYRADGERLEFRLKPVGRGTRLLGSLPTGAALGVVGPLGNGFCEPSGRPVLVGGGTGIASLYELAARSGSRAHVLLGGATCEEILGLEDFEALPVELEISTEDGTLGYRGRITELLRPAPGDEIYACGPREMMWRCYRIARDARARCWTSLETNMACGFGICLGCAIQTRDGFRYVCTDGPVFDAATVDWDALP